MLSVTGRSSVPLHYICCCGRHSPTDRCRARGYWNLRCTKYVFSLFNSPFSISACNYPGSPDPFPTLAHRAPAFGFIDIFTYCFCYGHLLSYPSTVPLFIFTASPYCIMIRTYGAYRCFATIMIKFAIRQLCKHIGSLALIIS